MTTPRPCAPASALSVPTSPSSPPVASRICSSGWTLEAGWSAGTNRSSPHQTWTRCQSIRSRSGGEPRARYIGAAAEPPVVTQCATPRASIADRMPSAMAVAAAMTAASGSGSTRSWGRAGSVGISGSLGASERVVGQCWGPMSWAALRIVSTASGSRPPVSSASPEQVDLAPSRGLERAVDRLDAVEPGVDVDVVGLGGDVGAQLAAPPLGEDLDPQRRARRASSRRSAA